MSAYEDGSVSWCVCLGAGFFSDPLQAHGRGLLDVWGDHDMLGVPQLLQISWCGNFQSLSCGAETENILELDCVFLGSGGMKVGCGTSVWVMW